MATSINVQIGAFTRNYIVKGTTAPQSYDGFGTLTIYGSDGGERVVLIDSHHYQWQEARYRSGLHQCRDCDYLPASAVEEMLWERLARQEVA